MKTLTGLAHKISTKDIEGNTLIIEIRLDDECKNGHQDFAITGSGFQKGKPMTDRYHIYGGCCHDEIIAARPDLKIFVDLHLSDYEGIPMYAAENGFYHLRAGFNNEPPESLQFKTHFCECYRLTGEQFDKISESRNATQYAVNLEKLGVIDQWREQAKEGIKLLETLTGEKFVVNSPKKRPVIDPEKAKEETKRESEGYYTPEAETAREEARKQAYFDKLQDEAATKCKRANDEAKTLKLIAEIVGIEHMEQVIFYSHSYEVGLNWRGYGEKIPADTIQKIREAITAFPEGIKVKEAK